MRDHQPSISLGGASAKAKSREQVLRDADAQRAVRTEARRRQRAAEAIQRAWRGHLARERLMADWLAAWNQQYYAQASAAASAAPLPLAETRCAVQLLLAARLPPQASTARRQIESGRTLPLQREPAQRRAFAALTTMLTRSLKCPGGAADSVDSSGASNYHLPGPGGVQRHVFQAHRLVLLCCAALCGAEPPDLVVDAAAARLIELLLLPGSGGGDAADAMRALLLTEVAKRPLPLMSATRRTAARAVGGPGSGSGAGDTTGAALPASITNTTVLSRLTGLSLGLVDHHHQQQQQCFVAAATHMFVEYVLSAPGLVAVLPEAVYARMLQPCAIVAMLQAAEALGRERKLCGGAAAALLGNLAHLLLGTPGRPASCGDTLLRLPASPHLASHSVSVAFCAAVLQLLPVAAAGGRELSGPESSAVLSQLALLGAQGALLQLLGVLSDEMPLFGALCLHLMQDLPTAEAALALSPGTSQQQGSDTTGSGGGGGAAAVNALAFAPQVLPALWWWLSINLGVPLAAPLAARLGLDVESVAGGCRMLQPYHALVLGVFCRALSQLLLVLSDDDLHVKGTPFDTAAARAIATSLNALVYHTHFPRRQQQPHQHQQQLLQQQQQQQGRSMQALGTGHAGQLPPATLRAGASLLERYAPQALRGLYERDQRRPFCQPALWTAPYDAHYNGGGRPEAASSAAPGQQGGGGNQPSGLRAAAAVVQGLLFGTGASAVNHGAAEAGSSAGGVSAAPAIPLQAVHGGSPSAMTALLRSAPQCVPFNVRLQLFRQLLQEDKVRGRWDAPPSEGGPRHIKLSVRRDTLLEDAFASLAGKGDALKGRLYVTFINSSGLPEAGLDHGGLTKELLEQTVAMAMQPGYGLFELAQGSGLVYPSPAAESIPQGLALLEFTGLMVGKALYEGILLDLALAPPLVMALQGARPSIDDLASVDAGLASGLQAVRGYAGDASDLGLTFSVELNNFGRTVSVDLLPGGSSVPVTNDNRTLYCHLLADFHLNRRLGRPAAAFAAGMSRVLPLVALRLFSPLEFNQLLSGGAEGGIDVEDWRAHTRYSNGYSESSRAVSLFWDVVEEMTPQQRAALLRFVTSCGRPPLGGFQHLNPAFTIARVDCGPRNPLAGLVGRDVELLPSASTCFCLLKLPTYSTKRGLRDKLLYAITSGAGFELS